MNDEQNKDQTRKVSGGKTPYMLGYTVRPMGDGQKSHWSKVAVAWAHKDGQGFNVQMDALPVDGRLVLRAVNDDEDEALELLEDTPPGLT
ncbi:hypothetical protein [Epibacterium ulvae]|uniref:hypothetical protein n=1 Tax=Epibacterium ulvae TaxID=1156985 RepID=UPI0024911B24|nr:hypothetical protein [Epibacterium ulvae]